MLVAGDVVRGSQACLWAFLHTWQDVPVWPKADSQQPIAPLLLQKSLLGGIGEGDGSWVVEVHALLLEHLEEDAG